jgi:hypothetical protein
MLVKQSHDINSTQLSGGVLGGFMNLFLAKKVLSKCFLSCFAILALAGLSVQRSYAQNTVGVPKDCGDLTCPEGYYPARATSYMCSCFPY